MVFLLRFLFFLDFFFLVIPCPVGLGLRIVPIIGLGFSMSVIRLTSGWSEMITGGGGVGGLVCPFRSLLLSGCCCVPFAFLFFLVLRLVRLRFFPPFLALSLLSSLFRLFKLSNLTARLVGESLI